MCPFLAIFIGTIPSKLAFFLCVLEKCFQKCFHVMDRSFSTYSKEQLPSLWICKMLYLPITIFHKSFMKSNLKTAKITPYNGLQEMLYYGYIHFYPSYSS